MEDELDDRILYQTYISHMKIMSKIVWGIPLNVSPISYSSHIWRVMRIYIFRPEVIIFSTIMLLIFLYMQAVDIWSRNLLGRLQYTINKNGRSKIDKLSLFSGGEAEKNSWQMKVGHIAAFAIQGRRPKMEDRFVINDNINNTGVGLFAVFDGHGGEFAANYAKEKLIQSLYDKVVEIKDLISGKKSIIKGDLTMKEGSKEGEKPKTPLVERRKSFKYNSITDECIRTSGKEITDPELLTKLNNISRPITREVKPSSALGLMLKKTEASDYFDKCGIVNYGKLITDEVLAADHSLLEAAKKNFDIAGTTALIAILEGSKLIVGNVGDSRGVMCDSRGNAIPLSFDHKPQQMRERKRIKEAGGFVTFNGVWRVAGILATSRALGDYPLKDKKFVIADPDILTFELEDHKPLFVILASDGLWDTFSNDEAVNFIKERLHEPDFGAKSLTLQSYFRGSLDNISVIIINFREHTFGYSNSEWNT